MTTAGTIAASRRRGQIGLEGSGGKIGKNSASMSYRMIVLCPSKTELLDLAQFTLAAMETKKQRYLAPESSHGVQPGTAIKRRERNPGFVVGAVRHRVVVQVDGRDINPPGLIIGLVG